MKNLNLQKNLARLDSEIPLTILLILLVFYCINDLFGMFMWSKVVCYIIISLLIKKAFNRNVNNISFHKMLPDIIIGFLLCWIVKNYFNLGYSYTLVREILGSYTITNESSGLKLLFNNYYCIMFIVLVILSVIYSIIGKSSMKIKILRYYGVLGIILNLIFMRFSEYKILSFIICAVLLINIFISIFYDFVFKARRFYMSLFYSLMIIMSYLIFKEEFTSSVNYIINPFTKSLLFMLGYTILSVVLLSNSENVMNQYIGLGLLFNLGFSLIYYFSVYELNLDTVFWFNIVAVFLFNFYMINYKKGDVILVLGISYICSFLLTSLFVLELVPAVIFLVPTIISVYYFRFFDSDKFGEFYHILIFGSVNWIMCELVLFSLGKLEGFLIIAILVTVVVWGVIGIGLSWSNDFNKRYHYGCMDKIVSLKTVRLLSAVPYIMIGIFICTVNSRISIVQNIEDTTRFLIIDYITNEDDKVSKEYRYCWDFGKTHIINTSNDEGAKVRMNIEGKLLKIETRNENKELIVRYYYVND